MRVGWEDAVGSSIVILTAVVLSIMSGCGGSESTDDPLAIEIGNSLRNDPNWEIEEGYAVHKEKGIKLDYDSYLGWRILKPRIDDVRGLTRQVKNALKDRLSATIGPPKESRVNVEEQLAEDRIYEKLLKKLKAKSPKHGKQDKAS